MSLLFETYPNQEPGVGAHGYVRNARVEKPSFGGDIHANIHTHCTAGSNQPHGMVLPKMWIPNFTPSKNGKTRTMRWNGVLLSMIPKRHKISGGSCFAALGDDHSSSYLQYSIFSTW